jgi:hypothetical protein
MGSHVELRARRARRQQLGRDRHGVLDHPGGDPDGRVGRVQIVVGISDFKDNRRGVVRTVRLIR